MGEGLKRARAAARATRAAQAPKFEPPQVTLLQAAEALIAKLDECGVHVAIGRFYGEADVLRQAIQREKAQ